MFCVVADFSETMKNEYKTSIDNENKPFLEKVVETLKNLIDKDLSEIDKVLAVGFGAKDMSVGVFDIIKSLQAATHFPTFCYRKQLENSSAGKDLENFERLKSIEAKKMKDLEIFEDLVKTIRSSICTNSFGFDGFDSFDLPPVDYDLSSNQLQKRKKLLNLLNYRRGSISSSLLRSFDKYAENERGANYFDPDIDETPFIFPKFVCFLSYDYLASYYKISDRAELERKKIISQMKLLNKLFSNPESDAYLSLKSCLNKNLPLIYDPFYQNELVKEVDKLWKHSDRRTSERNEQNWVEYEIDCFLEKKCIESMNSLEDKQWLGDQFENAQEVSTLLQEFEAELNWENLKEESIDVCFFKDDIDHSSEFSEKIVMMTWAVKKILDRKLDKFFNTRREKFLKKPYSFPKIQSKDCMIEFITQTTNRLTNYVHKNSESLQQTVSQFFEEHELEQLELSQETSGEMDTVLDQIDKEEKWWILQIKKWESLQTTRIKSDLTAAEELIRKSISEDYCNTKIIHRSMIGVEQRKNFNQFVKEKKAAILLEVYKQLVESKSRLFELQDHQKWLAEILERAEELRSRKTRFKKKYDSNKLLKIWSEARKLSSLIKEDQKKQNRLEKKQFSDLKEEEKDGTEENCLLFGQSVSQNLMQKVIIIGTRDFFADEVRKSIKSIKEFCNEKLKNVSTFDDEAFNENFASQENNSKNLVTKKRRKA